MLICKKYNIFIVLSFRLAWHSRGRGFDSLQLHQEECQGVTEKSVTPFSLAPCQLAANAPVGSDSPGPGRLTRLLPHTGGDLLRIFNRLPGKIPTVPQIFRFEFGRLAIFDALAVENNQASQCPASRTPSCVASARQRDGIMLFFLNIFIGCDLGWTLGLFGCVGGARSRATPRHRAE
jgi:hypothetical protein